MVMTDKQIRVIVNVVVSLVSAAIAFGITYLDSKYFLLGVQAERGYEAVGGEILFLLIIFCAIYYGIKHLIFKGIRELLEEINRSSYDE